jgi:uncharacterized protein
MNNVFSSLLHEADNIEIIDTHEHLDPYNTYNGDTPDVLAEYFFQNISTDLMSAGMSKSELDRIKNPEEDIEIRYAKLEPYLDRVRNTSYFRSIERAAQLIHGVQTIDKLTIRALNDRFITAACEKSYGLYIMKDICHIKKSINHFHSNDIKKVKTELFAPVLLPERVVLNKEPKQKTLDDFLESYLEEFRAKVADGIVAIKLATAYWRTLYFDDVDYKTASELYTKQRESNNVGGFPKPLQDYIIHYVLKCANDIGFVVQIHTGLQEGMEHNLNDSNPMLLQNLFIKYKNITFDIFHIGYPYERELMVLAKTHANVYLDMCWAHIISPYASRAAFSEMLDVLPYTKILAFGGDCAFYDGVVGHLSIAKENICKILAEKVLNNEMPEELGIRILHAVFRNNAARIFKIA